MKKKPKRTMPLDHNEAAVSIGLIAFGGLFSALACIASLPSHLSDVEPALSLLGLSQIIIFAFLFDLVRARFNESEITATSNVAREPESPPEMALEEAEEEEEEVTPPEVEAEDFLRKAQQRRRRVDESE